MKAREFYRSFAFLGKTQQNWIFHALLGKDYGHVYLENPQIQEKVLLRGKFLIEEAKKGVPLAYLLGESYFYGRRFKVTEDVLIPRPETEGLVERALALPWESALDLCTGSGVIAITLALERKTLVKGLDISEKALGIAQENGAALGAAVEFFPSDLFSNVQGSYDLIISNPPYVETGEVLKLSVGKWEPHLALDGGKEGLDLIKRIFDQAPHYLKEGGYLLLEIGENQAEATLQMAEECFYGTINVDLANKVRYFVGKKRKSC